jgi:hypothetical protein
MTWRLPHPPVSTASLAVSAVWNWQSSAAELAGVAADNSAAVSHPCWQCSGDVQHDSDDMWHNSDDMWHNSPATW